MRDRLGRRRRAVLLLGLVVLVLVLVLVVVGQRLDLGGEGRAGLLPLAVLRRLLVVAGHDGACRSGHRHDDEGLVCDHVCLFVLFVFKKE